MSAVTVGQTTLEGEMTRGLSMGRYKGELTALLLFLFSLKFLHEPRGGGHSSYLKFDLPDVEKIKLKKTGSFN